MCDAATTMAHLARRRGRKLVLSLCGCVRLTLNPLRSALVRYFEVAAISVLPA